MKIMQNELVQNNDSKQTILRINNVVKKYGNFVALKGVSMEVKEHDVVVLCGPSGGGKSTLLRTINGLESIVSGEIIYRDTPLNKHTLREIRKHVGMVFQQFNLFANCSVEENLTMAPMKVLGKSKAEALTLAQEYLDMFSIKDKLKAYPHELSGGQQQRVAIIRSLMMNPDIILFDEPTSALDPEMIKEVLDAMRRLSAMGMTMIVVTHEMGFAKEVANRICFLEEGEIVVNTDKNSFFKNTDNERLNRFLSMILTH